MFQWLIMITQNDGLLSAAMADQNLTVVPKTDYDNLLQLAHQYTTLCANLMSGGIDEQTIVVSIQHLCA